MFSEMFKKKQIPIIVSCCIIYDMHCYFSDEMSVNCEDVTGTVRKDVTFTCSVSLKKTLKSSKCCIRVYKFLYPEKYNDPTICREKFPPNPCEQRNSFTCRFTPTTVMKEQFRFFITTECGWEETAFTVNITGTGFNTAVYSSINVCNCTLFPIY